MATRNSNDLILEKLADGLDSTASLTKALLSEIRDSEADFATIKTELSILRENVKGLSDIICDGKGSKSIITSVALIEQNIQNINKWLESHITIHQTIKSDYDQLQLDLNDIQNKLDNIEKLIDGILTRKTEEEKKVTLNIEREIELQHEDKKTKIAAKGERQATITKIIGVVLIAIISALSGWIVNNINQPSQPQIINTNQSYQQTPPRVQPSAQLSVQPSSKP
jgi:chromosome segregation ATPase